MVLGMGRPGGLQPSDLREALGQHCRQRPLWMKLMMLVPGAQEKVCFKFWVLFGTKSPPLMGWTAMDTMAFSTVYR